MGSLEHHPFANKAAAEYPQIFAFDSRGDEMSWLLDSKCPELAPESYPPCRRSARFPQRRNYSGLYPFEGSERLIPFESLTEMRCLMELDREGNIASIAAQPFGLVFTDATFHYPDFAVRTTSGTRSIIDVKPRSFANDPLFLHSVARTREICELQGWAYRIMHGPEGWQADNLEWTWCFRFAEYAPDTDTAAKVLTALSEPRTLQEAAALIESRAHLGLGYAGLSNLIYHRRVVTCEPGPLHPQLLVMAAEPNDR